MPAEAEKGAGPFIILVDSYFVTKKYLAFLRSRAYTILMDDLGTVSYPVDCLINYNITADHEVYERLYKGMRVKTPCHQMKFKSFFIYRPPDLSRNIFNIPSAGGKDAGPHEGTV